jgi:hypothetical protein
VFCFVAVGNVWPSLAGSTVSTCMPDRFGRIKTKRTKHDHDAFTISVYYYVRHTCPRGKLALSLNILPVAGYPNVDLSMTRISMYIYGTFDIESVSLKAFFLHESDNINCDV